MRAVVLFSLLCFCCLLQSSSADDLIDKVVVLIIMYVESILQHYKTIDILSNPDPVSVNTSISEGTLSCDKIFLYGLGGLVVDKNYINFNLDDANEKLEFALYISIPSEVGIQVSGYKADAGITIEDDKIQIPLYGSGNISMGLKALYINISLDVSWKDEFEVTNFEIKPRLGAAKVNLTGFWKNDELSLVIAKVLTGLFDIVVIFWDLEINCISCVLTTVIESVLNKSDDFWGDIQNQCNSTCGISSYSFVRTTFNSDVSETVQNISEADVIKYIEIARDYLVANIEEYL